MDEKCFIETLCTDKIYKEYSVAQRSREFEVIYPNRAPFPVQTMRNYMLNHDQKYKRKSKIHAVINETAQTETRYMNSIFLK